MRPWRVVEAGELGAADVGMLVRLRRPVFSSVRARRVLETPGDEWAEGALLEIRAVGYFRGGAYEPGVVLVLRTARDEVSEVGPLYAEHQVEVIGRAVEP